MTIVLPRQQALRRIRAWTAPARSGPSGPPGLRARLRVIGSVSAAYPVVAIAACCGLAAIGFRTVFEGWRFAGPVFGTLFAALALALLADRWHLRTGPAMVLQVATAVMYLPGMLGLEQARFGLPWPAAIAELVRSLVNGPVRLLTLPAPVRTMSELLAAPVVAVWFGFVGGWLLLRRVRPVVALLGPAGVWILALAFGPPGQRYLALMAGAFLAAVLLFCALVKGMTTRRVIRIGRRWHLPLRGAGVVGAALAVAMLVAPRIPLISTRDRFTLREWRQPPFDPTELPSPLASFARYFQDVTKNQTMFTATGDVPERWRLAALTSYDGRVWSVGRPDDAGGGRFELIGARLQPTRAAKVDRRRTTVRLVDLGGVWLPVPGIGTRLEAERSVRIGLRYNAAANVLVNRTVAPSRPEYTMDWVPIARPDDAELAQIPADASVGVGALPELPEVLKSRAAKFADGEDTAFGKAKALELALHRGFYSEYLNAGGQLVTPGHAYGNLVRMFADSGGSSLVGNDEQYAAVFATMARALGLPVRVVVGFRPKVLTGRNRADVLTIKGSDARAWPEVHFAGVGWVAFDPTPPRSKAPEERETQAESRIRRPEVPAVTAARPSPPENQNGEPKPGKKTKKKAATKPVVLGVPAFVYVPSAGATAIVVLVGAKLGLAAWMKTRRRRRRRGGHPAMAIVGAWEEVLDRAREAGAGPVSAHTLHQTAAQLFPVGDHKQTLLCELGTIAEHAAFAPEPPSPAQAHAAWEIVERLGERLRAEGTRWQHLRRLASWRVLRTRNYAVSRSVVPL